MVVVLVVCRIWGGLRRSAALCHSARENFVSGGQGSRSQDRASRAKPRGRLNVEQECEEEESFSFLCPPKVGAVVTPAKTGVLAGAKSSRRGGMQAIGYAF